MHLDTAYCFCIVACKKLAHFRILYKAASFLSCLYGSYAHGSPATNMTGNEANQAYNKVIDDSICASYVSGVHEIDAQTCKVPVLTMAWIP